MEIRETKRCLHLFVLEFIVQLRSCQTWMKNSDFYFFVVVFEIDQSTFVIQSQCMCNRL